MIKYNNDIQSDIHPDVIKFIKMAVEHKCNEIDEEENEMLNGVQND